MKTIYNIIKLEKTKKIYNTLIKAIHTYQQNIKSQVFNKKSFWKDYLFPPNNIRYCKQLDKEKNQKHLSELKSISYENWSNYIKYNQKISDYEISEQKSIKQYRFDYKIQCIYIHKFDCYVKEIIKNIKLKLNMYYGQLLFIYASLGTLSHNPQYTEICIQLQSELQQFDIIFHNEIKQNENLYTLILI
ncbi:MAG: hypothetical protein WC934_01920 [Acidithiobacillus sp.]|jgi:hypothetical protein|uniref:hypothetical protein n=1 Tax=Acidithiobacillus sp. TaxID=1872118 RepID=UPI00355DF735